jgi:type IV secretory pathway TraG/TraD family ATPase VirD4
MSLYIIVPPVRLAAYGSLLRMWLAGLILAMTQRKVPPKERTHMLCDDRLARDCRDSAAV